MGIEEKKKAVSSLLVGGDEIVEQSNVLGSNYSIYTYIHTYYICIPHIHKYNTNVDNNIHI